MLTFLVMFVVFSRYMLFGLLDLKKYADYEIDGQLTWKQSLESSVELQWPRALPSHSR